MPIHRMARRSGGSHKGVEEKRRNLPIYQHYTLSPGKTKSHHPEAKCNHCLKEFVCGSKQRLIRHLRKCNSITNPEEIIAETLNTLARNSATGQLNHSILEASNLLPSQIPNHIHHHHHHQSNAHPTLQLVGQQIHHPSSTNAATNINNHNTSACSETGLIASSSNGSQPSLASLTPIKRSQRRGRRPANQSLASNAPSIHVTTGLDGKTHFTPASQLPPNITGSVGAPIIAQVHNGRQVGYTYHTAPGSASTTPITTSGTHMNTSSSNLTCATPNHHPIATYKLNSEPIDKAYLKLVLTRNLPISLCDTKEFQVWVKTFANDYKPPSSINLIAQNLKNESQAARQRISNILVKCPKKTINLELQRWPDSLRGHLWYSIIANIDHKRFLISVRDINFEQHQQVQSPNEIKLDQSEPSDKRLANFIDDCIRRVGSDRINSLVLSGRYEGDKLTDSARKLLYSMHPSIVTYYCWWHFTNMLCSDIIEYSETFHRVLKNSNRLINFVSKRHLIFSNLEKFNPFADVASSICSQSKNDKRWYSHLVCYLLEYIKNNNEAITRALETYSITPVQSHLLSDNNNNSSSETSNTRQVGNVNSSTQHQQTNLCQDDSYISEIKCLVASSEYWTDLYSALAYLKPIHDIVALTSMIPSQPSNTSSLSEESSTKHPTPSILLTTANSLSLSDYMHWFLEYGKTLFDSWRQSPDNYKYQLIGKYLERVGSSISEFKLLFASYLLNPKHRCAYVTQQAKNIAIEEILNIASEFMPEEVDGHTIFDQWKLYLVREEPYDMVYEESRSTPLEWWMSLPCAESIRRVALRILRLRAFASPKPETIFSQLYFYEDEMKSVLNSSAFEDIAVLRYFYDYEDKIGLSGSQHTSHNHASNNNTSNISSNGCQDRTQVGQLHNRHLHESNCSTKCLPSSSFEIAADTNGQLGESLSMSGERQNFSDSFSDVVVEAYMNNHPNISLDAQPLCNLSIETLPAYDLFTQYVDYNESGVQVVEEPIEKKKRKWTAQEILSKQNHHNSNNNNDINSK